MPKDKFCPYCTYPPDLVFYCNICKFGLMSHLLLEFHSDKFEHFCLLQCENCGAPYKQQVTIKFLLYSEFSNTIVF